MYPHIEELVKAVYICYKDFAMTTVMLYCLLLIQGKLCWLSLKLFFSWASLEYIW